MAALLMAAFLFAITPFLTAVGGDLEPTSPNGFGQRLATRGTPTSPRRRKWGTQRRRNR